MTTGRYVLRRRTLASAASALVALKGAKASARIADKVVFQTNWRAEAEHGGYYQALARGIYRRYGLDVELRQGGPQVNGAQLLLGGRIDMFMSNGLQAINHVRGDLPLLAIGAIFQKDPQILMTHAGADIDGFAAMRGRPILVSPEGRMTYWPFLRARFGFTDDQIRPYTFNLQPFLADRNAIQQGYITAEPFAARQAGARPVAHLIADAGYENYNETIEIAARTVRDRREVVQRFVDASMEGWAEYLRRQDIGAANALIKRDNPDMDEARIDYALSAMQTHGLVRSGDALTLGIGAMTDARWARFYAQMVEYGVHPPGIDVRRAYSLDFVNRRIGL